MGSCCGGKNAGKPVSWPRFLAGVGVSVAYHGAVSALLHAVAIPFRRFRVVRDFQRALFMKEMREVMARVDITVQGLRTRRPSHDPVDDACPAAEPVPLRPEDQPPVSSASTR